MTNSFKYKITIAMPILNEAINIDKTIKSIISNNMSFDEAELLIIDGGSTDNTLDIIREHTNALNIRIIDYPGSTVYQALNLALENAQGEFFVRIDARSQIPPSYIKSCINNMNITHASCAGGIQFQYGINLFSKAVSYVVSKKFGNGGAKFRNSDNSGFVDSVYLGVYKTEQLRNLNGFEDQARYVSEDSLINKRIRDAGGRIFLDATLKVLYPAKSNLKDLLKQYFIYGAARSSVFKKYKTLTSFRQAIPILFIFFWILSLISYLIGFLSLKFFSLLIFGYLSLIVLINIRDLQDNFFTTLFYRSIATLSIHFIWPLGFLLYLISPSLHQRFMNFIFS